MAKPLKSITFPGLEGEYDVVNPMDYGLGTVCQSIGSWNDALVNGYYKSNGDAPDGYWWWGEVIAYADNSSVVQHVMRWVEGNISHVWRTGARDAWGEWEWENPPMTSGVEYRTTQRYLGKPVYTRCYNLGATGEKDYHLNTDIPRPGSIVFQAVGDDESFALPVIDASTGERNKWIEINANTDKFIVITIRSRTMDWANRATTVQIWYTKP